MSLMNSNNSDPKKSQPQKTESPRQKRVYCQLGILESRKDFAERMYRRMKDAGILPPEPRQSRSSRKM